MIIRLSLLLVMFVSCVNRDKMGKEENATLLSIHNRRSVRSYTEKIVSEDQLITLIKAGMAAPTGKDVRPWEFIILTDRGIMDSLADTLPYAKMLKGATAAIVVCGNDDVNEGGSSYWYLDCSAATQNILIAAQSMGLGAVWTAAYPYPERMNPVKTLLNLPENIQPLNIIPVGYPKMEGKPKDKFNADKIHINGWNKK